MIHNDVTEHCPQGSMASGKKCVFVLLVLLSIAGATLVNEKVATSIDLSTHIAIVKSSVDLRNSGSTSVKSFQYAIEPSLSDNFAFISATVDDNELNVVEDKKENSKEGRFFQISLSTALEAGKTVTVDISVHLVHAIEPFPKQIGQNDKQLVRFVCSAYYYSKYSTVTQTTTFALPTSTPESYTKAKPVTMQDKNIVYGPYEDTNPLSTKMVTVHFENNSPFLTVLEVDRLIEVSHWGNIAVEEQVRVRHNGAELKGAFSRFDYQRNPQSGQAAVKSFKTILPAAARDVYYRDEIGNISTSNLREDAEAVEVELRPRFPLFGGWQTQYTLGYNIPSYEYLYRSGKQYSLKMRFVDHIYDDQVIDQITVRVILPEGAKNIKLKSPYHIEEKKRVLHYTYLDVTGRPVVTATKRNLIEQHIQDFELDYDFESYLMLMEPLLVTGALYIFFITVIIIVRLDFTISQDKSELARQRASAITDIIAAATNERIQLVSTAENTIESAKQSKQTSKLQKETKSLSEKWKQIGDKIDTEAANLAQDSPETVGKVKEIQAKSAALLKALEASIALATRAINGSIDINKYDKEEKGLSEDRRKLIRTIQDMVNGL